ncbi:hypothetical protein FACS1894181_01810 [Bacteroidia bacterium]|nr:hypothetical protein FACS1894181_01810 [Bacteroidia bacterium]
MNIDESLFLSYGRLLYHLRIDEHQEYVQIILSRMEPRILAIGDIRLTALWNEFKGFGTLEDLLYSQPKSAEETAVITDLNGKRTTILIYIFDFIDNILNKSPHEDDVEKAKHLDHMSEPYKKAPGKNIAGKTADIRNFIEDIMVEPYATYATDLNLMKTIPVLRAANIELETNYILRAAMWKEKEKYGSLSQLRPIEDDAMQKATDMAEFLYKVNEYGAKDEALRAKFEALFTAWNSITEQFERVLAQRGIKIPHDKPSPNYPTPPEDPQPPSPPEPPDFE